MTGSAVGSHVPQLRIVGRYHWFDGMWKVGMSEEVGKALQAVGERVNQAAARRPKVTRLAHTMDNSCFAVDQ